MARRRHRRTHGKTAMRKKMKSCAKRHRVATRGFWACVRKGRKHHRR